MPSPAGAVPTFSGAAWLVDDFEKAGAHFNVTISAPATWTKLTFPLSQFAQPDGAKKVDASMQDVTHVTFGALEGDKDFDLWVDEIRFVR